MEVEVGSRVCKQREKVYTLGARSGTEGSHTSQPSDVVHVFLRLALTVRSNSTVRLMAERIGRSLKATITPTITHTSPSTTSARSIAARFTSAPCWVPCHMTM